MPLKLELTYYPWITQSISGPALAAAVSEFATIVEQELATRLSTSVNVTVLGEMDIADQIAHVTQDPAGTSQGTIALMNPLGYAATHSATTAVEALAVVRRVIDGRPGPTYKSQIYVNASSGINDLSKLRKRSFAFGSPQSTSNFLKPAHVLWSAKIHPLHAFSRLEFAGGHDMVAKAVYEGRVDAGAGHDGVIHDLAAKPGYSDAADRLTAIRWSEEIPSDPVVGHFSDPHLSDAVAAALLAVAPATDPATAGNAAILKFWGTKEGLERIAPDAYDGLLQDALDLGLRPSDMLRRA